MTIYKRLFVYHTIKDEQSVVNGTTRRLQGEVNTQKRSYAMEFIFLIVDCSDPFCYSLLRVVVCVYR